MNSLKEFILGGGASFPEEIKLKTTTGKLQLCKTAENKDVSGSSQKLFSFAISKSISQLEELITKSH